MLYIKNNINTNEMLLNFKHKKHIHTDFKKFQFNGHDKYNKYQKNYIIFLKSNLDVSIL